MDKIFVIYVYVFTVIIGLVMGSFLNCMAMRISRHESILGRSHCENCGHELGFLDLIPIFSYIFSKGKCRYCGQKISIRYPISEIVSALVFVLIVKEFWFTRETIEYLILASICLAISFCDLEDFTIPNVLIVLGIINRIVFILLGNNIPSELLNSLISGLIASVPVLVLSIVMDKILKKDTMGGGDIKLLFMLGLYLATGSTTLTIGLNLVGLLLSCVIGIIFGVISTKGEKGKAFPFGPSICLGFLLSLLYGSRIVIWYLSLFV